MTRQPTETRVRVIYDTDLGSDVDDVEVCVGMKERVIEEILEVIIASKDKNE